METVTQSGYHCYKGHTAKDETDNHLWYVDRMIAASNSKKPAHPTTATEQSIAEKIGDGLELGSVSKALLYDPALRGLNNNQRKALVNMVARGIYRIYHVNDQQPYLLIAPAGKLPLFQFEPLRKTTTKPV